MNIIMQVEALGKVLQRRLVKKKASVTIQNIKQVMQRGHLFCSNTDGWAL